MYVTENYVIYVIYVTTIAKLVSRVLHTKVSEISWTVQRGITITIDFDDFYEL